MSADPASPGATQWGALPSELKSAEYLRLAREFAMQPPPGFPPLRVAALSSFTIDFVKPFLVVECARLGFAATTYVGPFGQFEQELGNPQSGLHDFGADALVLALRPEDVDPDAVVRYYATSGRRFRDLAAELTERLIGCTRRFRDAAAGPVLVANFATPVTLPLGPLEANGRESLVNALAEANARLCERVATVPGAVIWDYAGLVARVGSDTWTDPRLWALGRIAVSAANQSKLAVHLARTLRAVKRPAAKCLVLDLDQTLWGGVIGDDGLHGVRLGDEYPGSAFKDFQRHVLALRDRGILLAVASKNDHEVARQMFVEHPEMLIRWEDLAAVRIDWSPKSGNIRAMAAELGLGADAMVLFDDNPVERAEVRANAPEVHVIEVPRDPLHYVASLAAAVVFDQVALSEEDRARAGMYHEERQRQVLAADATSPEEFLRSLEMVARVGEASPATIGRIGQLIGKTNQFNLTTRRHSPAELATMVKSSRDVVAWLRLSDRFGDQGLVAVGILRVEGTRGTIDSFLMSCRVMNRGVERALLAYLAEHARRLGCAELAGEYAPTARNGMVRNFYPSLGFASLDAEGRYFRIGLDAPGPAWPPAIQREDSSADPSADAGAISTA